METGGLCMQEHNFQHVKQFKKLRKNINETLIFLKIQTISKLTPFIYMAPSNAQSVVFKFLNFTSPVEIHSPAARIIFMYANRYYWRIAQHCFVREDTDFVINN